MTAGLVRPHADSEREPGGGRGAAVSDLGSRSVRGVDEEGPRRGGGRDHHGGGLQQQQVGEQQRAIRRVIVVVVLVILLVERILERIVERIVERGAQRTSRISQPSGMGLPRGGSASIRTV